MGYYLLNNPNPHGPHYYKQRRAPLRVVVVHITAGLEDLDPPDPSAERTARYAASTRRRVSWHSGSDTDSFLYLLPPRYVAFHVKDYNTISYGHEISKRDTNWDKMPADWIRSTLRNAADCLKPVVEEFKIPLRKISTRQVHQGEKGFIGHWELDPGRRDDPGRYRGRDTFPWNRFFTAFVGDEEIDMRKGDRNGDVRKLQMRLKDAGFDIQVDGWFGDETERAIRGFQQRQGLEVTGRPSMMTLVELQSYAHGVISHQRP